MIPAKSSQFSRRGRATCEIGATMLEAAIALPLFLVVVLGMIDFSVRVIAQGVLNQAALTALNMASKLQGIENWTEGVPADGASATRFNQVLAQIESEALRVSAASFIEPQASDSLATRQRLDR